MSNDIVDLLQALLEETVHFFINLDERTWGEIKQDYPEISNPKKEPPSVKYGQLPGLAGAESKRKLSMMQFLHTKLHGKHVVGEPDEETYVAHKVQRGDPSEKKGTIYLPKRTVHQVSHADTEDATEVEKKASAIGAKAAETWTKQISAERSLKAKSKSPASKVEVMPQGSPEKAAELTATRAAQEKEAKTATILGTSKGHQGATIKGGEIHVSSPEGGAVRTTGPEAERELGRKSTTDDERTQLKGIVDKDLQTPRKKVEIGTAGTGEGANVPSSVFTAGLQGIGPGKLNRQTRRDIKLGRGLKGGLPAITGTGKALSGAERRGLQIAAFQASGVPSQAGAGQAHTPVHNPPVEVSDDSAEGKAHVAAIKQSRSIARAKKAVAAAKEKAGAPTREFKPSTGQTQPRELTRQVPTISGKGYSPEFHASVDAMMKKSAPEIPTDKPEVKWEDLMLKLSSTLGRLYEREFSQPKRKKLAKKGSAMKDGSFPIENEKDLKNAERAIGRAHPSKRAKVRAHIRKRAAALGVSLKGTSFEA